MRGSGEYFKAMREKQVSVLFLLLAFLLSVGDKGSAVGQTPFVFDIEPCDGRLLGHRLRMRPGTVGARTGEDRTQHTCRLSAKSNKTQLLEFPLERGVKNQAWPWSVGEKGRWVGEPFTPRAFLVEGK